LSIEDNGTGDDVLEDDGARKGGAARPRDGSRRVTLVLGGGGARGLAHFGVLEVLEDSGIEVAALVANSAGALAAAVYLQHESARAAGQYTVDFLTSPRFQRHKLQFRLPGKEEGKPAPTVLHRLLSGWRRQVAMHLLFRRPSLFHARRLEGVVRSLVKDVRIEELPVPLKIVAMDLGVGEEVVLDSGKLVPALMASCSVAGFFPPVELEGRRLIDSGQSDNLPVQVALPAAEGPIVAVNLSAGLECRADFMTGIEIMFRSEEIGSRWNTRLRARDADVVITPRTDGRFWLDFSDPAEVVRAGAEAARASMPQLETILDQVPRPGPGRPSPRSAPSSS
jgi:NTE family protein